MDQHRPIFKYYSYRTWVFVETKPGSEFELEAANLSSSKTMWHYYMLLLFIVFELTPPLVFADTLEKLRAKNPNLKVNPVIKEARVDCTDEYITAIISLREPFRGMLYADGHSDPKCSVSGDGTQYKVSLTLEAGECGVKKNMQDGHQLQLEAKFYLQFHYLLQGGDDQTFRFVCVPSIFHDKPFVIQAGMFGVRRKEMEHLLIRRDEEEVEFAARHQETGAPSTPASEIVSSREVIREGDEKESELLNEEPNPEKKHKPNKQVEPTPRQKLHTRGFQETVDHEAAKPKADMEVDSERRSHVDDTLNGSVILERKLIIKSKEDADPNQVVEIKSTVKPKPSSKHRQMGSHLGSSRNDEQEANAAYLSAPCRKVVPKNKPATAHGNSTEQKLNPEQNGTQPPCNVRKNSPIRFVKMRSVPVPWSDAKKKVAPESESGEMSTNTEDKSDTNTEDKPDTNTEDKSDTNIEFKMQVNQMTHFTPTIDFIPREEVTPKKVHSKKGLRLMSGDHEEYIKLIGKDAEMVARMLRPELIMKMYPGFVEPPVDFKITGKRVGKKLTMVIIAKQHPGLDSQVVNCTANDFTNDHIQLLINIDGCSVNEKIMSNLKDKYISEAMEKVFYSHFRAFKFPHTNKVYITCALRFCKGSCEKPDCTKTKPMLNSNVTSGTYELDPEESLDGSQISMLSEKNNDEEINDELTDDETIQDSPDAMEQRMPKVTITDESDHDPLTMEEQYFCINFVRFACLMLFFVLLLLVSLVVTICMCVSAKELKKRLRNMSMLGYGKMT
ncbi:hypothetical protein JTE90_008811 [Oedothorax gibbosus]|uniref:ZP domain-containing protein n=1 Tax=Oedothorax gibbosus TaxID=931172 RepID=A0AAV6V7Q3_9ARAC|nr:hypothetical protein JTE90_008811 [Oedothorax gibbosus]